MLDGLIGGHVADKARDRRNERIRIRAGVDEKAAAKDGTLFKGAINGDDGPRNDMLVVNIGGDANDAVRRGVNPGSKFHHGIGPIDMAADGILIGEHALCERLADNSDGLLTLPVELVEITSAEDGNAQRGKESGRNDTQLRARILARRMNMAVGRELQPEPAGAELAPGNSQTESGLVHAGQRITPPNE